MLWYSEERTGNILSSHWSNLTRDATCARVEEITSSSAVAERPRDALFPSVVSLNKIITRAEFFLLLLKLQIYHCVTLSSA